MAHYGKVLNDYDPEKDHIYDSFVLFFNNPKMIKQKDVEGLSMYITKTFCLLSNQCRYIIALVMQDNKNIGYIEDLSNLFWVSFQTRTLQENFDTPSHSYTPQRGCPLDTPIKRDTITQRASDYTCEKFPCIRVTLLHTSQGPSEYQDTGAIITALETYQTVISFK